MKEKFYEYIDPKAEEIEEVWKNGIISVDANILLNFYRYTEKTREEFFSALAKCEDQLWLTHQAGEEFFKNRRNLFKSLKSSYNETQKFVSNKIDELKSYIGGMNHPLIESAPLNDILDDCLSQIKEHLDQLANKHPDYTENDDVLDRIINLFDKKIGEPYSKEQLGKIYAEGKKRYDEKVPPGYCDSKKKEENTSNCYGDLVLWMQLIDKATLEKKALIFVTDDNKEDWWTKEKGISISARKELIKEFHDKTGMRIVIYNAMSFLRYLQAEHENSVEEQTINEVEKISSQQYITYEGNNDGFSIYANSRYPSSSIFIEPNDGFSIKCPDVSIGDSLKQFSSIDPLAGLKENMKDVTSLYTKGYDPIGANLYAQRPWESMQVQNSWRIEANDNESEWSKFGYNPTKSSK